MNACEAALVLTKFIYGNTEPTDRDADKIIKIYQKCYKGIEDVLAESLT